MATIGQVGNVEHSLIKLGKAGRKRLMGRRPQVRGSVMNPRRPPARRWRGQGADRHAGPEDAVGQADARLADARRKSTNKFIVRRRYEV